MAHPEAGVVAIVGGEIVYVGDGARAMALTGSAPRIEDLGAKRVPPGVVDAHTHPLSIVDIDSCDLNGQAMGLAQISDAVDACVIRIHIAPRQWINVSQ